MRNTTICMAMLIVCCCFGCAQEYKVLWDFGGSASGDGSYPQGGLALDSAGNLYGTTTNGGAFCPESQGCGTVFRLSPNPNGSWTETVLYSFCADRIGIQCLDGRSPEVGLTVDAVGNIYGTTMNGGDEACVIDGNGCGTVFELSPPSAPDGSWTEQVLYSFCAIPNGQNLCIDGDHPHGAVIFDALGNLYGTTQGGGTGRHEPAPLLPEPGTVFELSPGVSGWTHTVLYNFCSLGQGKFCLDGSVPAAGVTFDKSGNIYGTTELGGGAKIEGFGTVYRLSPGTSGWTESVLYQFRFPNAGTPLAKVTLDSAGSLYTTFSVSGQGVGGVLRLNSARGGTSKTVSFTPPNGATPSAGVTLDSQHRILYGTAVGGGQNSGGTIFDVVLPGQVGVLYNFCSQPNCSDGKGPQAGLTGDHAGHLYGTTTAGGSSNNGVVFEITQ